MSRKKDYSPSHSIVSMKKGALVKEGGAIMNWGGKRKEIEGCLFLLIRKGRN